MSNKLATIITLFLSFCLLILIVIKLNFENLYINKHTHTIQKHKDFYITQKLEAAKTLDNLKQELEKATSAKKAKIEKAKTVLLSKIEEIDRQIFRLSKGLVSELSETIFDKTAFEHEFII